MRRRYVSDEELNKIIKLKNAGASWLKVQDQTDVPRRTAKRAYEEHEQSKSIQELKAARQQVISDQFNHHLQDLILLAQSLTSSIGKPAIGDMRSAEEVINGVFKIDIRAHRVKNPMTGKITVLPEVVIRQNKVLFESLKNHTRERVNWKPLEEWRVARNSWINLIVTLKKEATEIVNNMVRQLPIGDVIVKKVGNNEISEIIDGVVDAVSRAILNDKLEEVEDLIKLIPQEQGTQITFSGGTSGKLLRYEDTALAESICELAHQSILNLCAVKESRIVDNMANAVSIMGKKKVVLEDMLDELRLIPLILGTRCDICPAL